MNSLLAVVLLALAVGLGQAQELDPQGEGLDAAWSKLNGAPSYALNSMLGPEMQLSHQSTGPGEDWYYPAAAYNSLRHSQIVLTHAHAATRGAIYGYCWSAANPDDGVWFLRMGGVQPAVAYNRTEDDFLVVAMYDPNLDGHYQIWGVIVQGDCSDGSVPFRIFHWANRGFWSPRVAWNSYRNEYLVVWNAVDTTTGLPSDVAAARVSASGTVLPGAPHIIATTNKPHQADVTYNPALDEYLVVWRKQAVTLDWDIWSARLRGSDIAVMSYFAVNAAPEDQRSPAVTTNQQGRYVVVWEYAYPGPCCDWDIRGQELDMWANPVGDVRIITQTTDDETNPRVVARPGPQRDYVTVWQKETATGSEIWARRWGGPGVQDEYVQVAAAAWWDHAKPTIAVTGPRYLFAYEADSGRSEPVPPYLRPPVDAARGVPAGGAEKMVTQECADHSSWECTFDISAVLDYTDCQAQGL